MALDNKLIQAALYEIESDTRLWSHLLPLVANTGDSTDDIIDKYLAKSKLKGNFPKESFTYTLRYLGGYKLIVIDTRRAESIANALDDVFFSDAPPAEGDWEGDYDGDAFRDRA